MSLVFFQTVEDNLCNSTLGVLSNMRFEDVGDVDDGVEWWCGLWQGILLNPTTLAAQRRARLRRAFTDATSETVTYVKTVLVKSHLYFIYKLCYLVLFFLSIFSLFISHYASLFTIHKSTAETISIILFYSFSPF